MLVDSCPDDEPPDELGEPVRSLSVSCEPCRERPPAAPGRSRAPMRLNSGGQSCKASAKSSIGMLTSANAVGLSGLQLLTFLCVQASESLAGRDFSSGDSASLNLNDTRVKAGQTEGSRRPNRQCNPDAVSVEPSEQFKGHQD